MLIDLCVCGVVPLRHTTTRLVLVMHHVEAMRQSNTGRLALSALEHMCIRLRGDRDRPLEVQDLLDAAYVARDPRPVTLFVPDGTWNTARKIPLRHPELRALPRVCLPVEAASQYRLRHNPHPEKVSTLEAIARAMGVLEGPELKQDLLHLFAVARDRILWSQGKLPEGEVTGGLAFRDWSLTRHA